MPSLERNDVTSVYKADIPTPYQPTSDFGYESGAVGVKMQNAIIETLEEDGSFCRVIPVEFRLIFV
jgi:hypothetical protein